MASFKMKNDFHIPRDLWSRRSIGISWSSFFPIISFFKSRNHLISVRHEFLVRTRRRRYMQNTRRESPQKTTIYSSHVAHFNNKCNQLNKILYSMNTSKEQRKHGQLYKWSIQGIRVGNDIQLKHVSGNEKLSNNFIQYLNEVFSR